MVKAEGFRGRLLVIAGILLVALTLRAAVTAVPPVAAEISRDLPLNSLALGLLGMLPPLTFAFFGFLTPFVLRWASVERLTVIAMVVAAIGQIARVFAPDTPAFLALTVIALAGMGAGNVLLPPLVKHYFPDRVGLITALYVTAMSLGTAIPAQLAVPVTETLGWQISLASWAGMNLVAALPWLSSFFRRPTPSLAETEHQDSVKTVPVPVPAPEQSAINQVSSRSPRKGIRIWRSPMALGLTLFFGCTSLNTYAMFAWLPQILSESGLSPAAAGNLLALYAGLGLPMSLLIPVLASRMRNQFPIVLALLSCYAAGYLGLLLAPAGLTVLWVILAGIGPGTFPLALLLINLRTRTREAAGALSGFCQGVGYAIACLGPSLFGLLHQATGNWAAGFGFLFVVLLVLGVGAFFACRPVYLEDQQGRS